MNDNQQRATEAITWPETWSELRDSVAAALDAAELRGRTEVRRRRLSRVCQLPDCGCDGRWHA